MLLYITRWVPVLIRINVGVSPLLPRQRPPSRVGDSHPRNLDRAPAGEGAFGGRRRKLGAYDADESSVKNSQPIERRLDSGNFE
jgi:hypothetical protein